MIEYDKTGCAVEHRRIPTDDGRTMKLMIVRPEGAVRSEPATGVLWLHGGGYLLGFPEMAFMSRAADLVRQCGAVLLCPAYRLSPRAPYPAALEDAHHALLYMKDHARDLGIRPDQIMVGGESAGGGLAAALCLYARDAESVRIAFQLPLYPMLDCEDTLTSADNHAKVWNTRRNRFAWRLYLRSIKDGDVPIYASPARCRDYRGLPPAYTFVGDAEPFYAETLAYVDALRKAGVSAEVDVYPGQYHAFDMMEPNSAAAREAVRRLCEAFRTAQRQCFAPQDGGIEVKPE